MSRAGDRRPSDGGDPLRDLRPGSRRGGSGYLIDGFLISSESRNPGRVNRCTYIDETKHAGVQKCTIRGNLMET